MISGGTTFHTGLGFKFGSDMLDFSPEKLDVARKFLENVEVVIVNQGNEPTFEEELAKDVLEIITVFSARLYGSRSNKNKKIIENLKGVVDVVST